MRLTTTLLALALCCFPVSAVEDYPSIYNASKTTVLAGTAETITIQNPNANKIKMSVRTVYVKCSAACDFTVERDGSAATTTTLAIERGSKVSQPPVGVAFSASNVGVGSFKWPYSITSPGGMSIAFTGIDLPGDGTSSNFSVKVAAFTGTVFVLIQWEEL